MNNHRQRAYVILIVVSLIWGVASTVIKLTLEGIDPLPFLTYRFFLSTLIGLFFIRKIIFFIRHQKQNFLAIFLYSIFTTSLGLGLLFTGLDTSTVLDLVLITLAAPLLTEYAGVVFLNERVTKREKVGTFIAFLGTIFVIIEPLLGIKDGGGGFLGNTLIFAYLACDIAGTIILKKLLRKNIDPQILTHTSFIIGFLTLLPFVFIAYKTSFITDIFSMPFKYHLGVIYMALISGTLAYILRAIAQKSIEVSEAALFVYLTNVFSTPIAVIFLSEKITLYFVLGAIIIAIGVFIAEKKSGKKTPEIASVQ